jgi:uncharacterized protein YndB with AHSA1/START domain
MADIIHEFFVNASPARVFEMFSTADGLNRWWTKEASGEPKLNTGFRLYFGPGYDWRAKVTRCVPSSEFELQMVSAGPAAQCRARRVRAVRKTSGCLA